MLHIRRFAWCFLALCWPPIARAQDSDVPFLLGDPPATDHEWNSEYDGSWDPGWDRSFSDSNRAWQLSLAGGAQWDSALAAATERQAASYYALALLQLPLDELMPRVRAKPVVAAKTETTKTKSQPADRSTAPTSDTGPDHSHLRSVHLDVPIEENTADASDGLLDSIGSKGALAARRVLQRQTLALFKHLLRHVSGTVGDRSALQDIASLARRSRWSGLVPELRVRGVYGFDRTVSQEGSSGIYPGDLTTRGGRDSLLEGRLSFRLDRLVYGEQEGSLYQRRRELRLGEEKRKREATDALASWLDARRRCVDPDLSPDDVAEAIHEEQSALLTLHLMSEGWFEGEATLQELGYIELLGAGMPPPDEPPTTPMADEISAVDTSAYPRTSQQGEAGGEPSQ